ncbi:MAG: hypothetical protein WCF90_06610 [Methanomicrobiales archaeon]
MLAATSAVLLGVYPAPLALFEALPGLMQTSRPKNVIIVDYVNSRSNRKTSLSAARYAQHLAQSQELTPAIGLVKGDGRVSEVFSHEQIASAVEEVRPSWVVRDGGIEDPLKCPGNNQDLMDRICATLENCRRTALGITSAGSIVLPVKTSR